MFVKRRRALPGVAAFGVTAAMAFHRSCSFVEPSDERDSLRALRRCVEPRAGRSRPKIPAH